MNFIGKLDERYEGKLKKYNVWWPRDAFRIRIIRFSKTDSQNRFVVKTDSQNGLVAESQRDAFRIRIIRFSKKDSLSKRILKMDSL